MTTLHVLRVFAGSNGRGGNPLGVFLDGRAVPELRRQQVAAELGFSETVFVLDRSTAELEIYTPAAPLPFAGHPLVGTSWLLDGVDVLRPPAGAVPSWRDDAGRRWIRGRAGWAPEMALRRYGGAAEVDALDRPEDGFLDAWAWIDESAGEVRARVFAPSHGIPEDEATGAAAVRLVTALGRPITIHQGEGSLLLARPGPDGTAEVGGTVALVETTEWEVSP